MLFFYILVTTFLGLGVVATWSQVEKPREPLTRGIAIASTICTVLIIAFLTYLLHRASLAPIGY